MILVLPTHTLNSSIVKIFFWKFHSINKLYNDLLIFLWLKCMMFL